MRNRYARKSIVWRIPVFYLSEIRKYAAYLFLCEGCPIKSQMQHHFDEAKKRYSHPNIQTHLLPTLLCIMKTFGEEEKGLFFLVDESCSKTDIERKNQENWPRLAVQGVAMCSAKSFTLLVDNTVVVHGMDSFIQALSVLFASYYVFNVAYPKEVAATLEFIQRCLVGLNPDRGCKASRKKKTSAVNPKILKLINTIADFDYCRPAEQSLD